MILSGGSGIMLFVCAMDELVAEMKEKRRGTTIRISNSIRLSDSHTGHPGVECSNAT